MSYQLIRTLVYTYPDADDALHDMGNWGMPASGVRSLGLPKGRSIVSSTTPLQKIIAEAEAASPETPEMDEDE